MWDPGPSMETQREQLLYRQEFKNHQARSSTSINKNNTQTPIVTFLVSSFNVLDLYSRYFKKYYPSRYLICILYILQLFLSVLFIAMISLLRLGLIFENKCFTSGTMLSLIVLSYFGSKSFLAVINLSVMHGILC